MFDIIRLNGPGKTWKTDINGPGKTWKTKTNFSVVYAPCLRVVVMAFPGNGPLNNHLYCLCSVSRATTA